MLPAGCSTGREGALAEVKALKSLQGDGVRGSSDFCCGVAPYDAGRDLCDAKRPGVKVVSIIFSRWSTVQDLPEARSRLYQHKFLQRKQRFFFFLRAQAFEGTLRKDRDCSAEGSLH